MAITPISLDTHIVIWRLPEADPDHAIYFGSAASSAADHSPPLIPLVTAEQLAKQGKRDYETAMFHARMCVRSALSRLRPNKNDAPPATAATAANKRPPNAGNGRKNGMSYP